MNWEIKRAMLSVGKDGLVVVRLEVNNEQLKDIRKIVREGRVEVDVVDIGRW